MYVRHRGSRRGQPRPPRLGSRCWRLLGLVPAGESRFSSHDITAVVVLDPRTTLEKAHLDRFTVDQPQGGAFQRANSRTGCLSPHPTELRSRAERRTALWLPHPHERHAPIASRHTTVHYREHARAPRHSWGQSGRLCAGLGSLSVYHDSCRHGLSPSAACARSCGCRPGHRGALALRW